MGWTTCFYSKYAEWKNGKRVMPPAARKKEIDDKLTRETKDADGKVMASHRVLKSAMVGSTYYGAVTTEKPGKPTEVWAAVFLTCGKSRWDNTIWGYKDMCESMLPYYFDCPAGILSLLTPTDNKNANEWREGCRQVLAEKAKKRKEKNVPLFVPEGVTVKDERGSWIFNSEHYQKLCENRYCGVKYTKKGCREYSTALRSFLHNFGTAAQKAEYAAKGYECPADWKRAAA